MNITRLAIENNRLTGIIVLVLIVQGVLVFLGMPRDYDPGFIVRSAQVTTFFPGASPERVEKLVSSRIEDSVKEIPELDFVKSESRTGVSIVTVNINESYKEMRPIWDNLRRKVDDIKTELPSAISGPFVNDDFGDVYGIVFTITGEGFDYKEIYDVAEAVQDSLLRLPDAAKVQIYGAQEERIFIEYNNSRLAELGISPYQISQALSSRNIVTSGGSFTLDNNRIALEPSGNFESLEDIGNTILRVPPSSSLFALKDIAEIKRGYVDPPKSMVHSSSHVALGIGIAMREGGNNIELGELVKKAVAESELDYPHGIEFDFVNFAPSEVDKKVSDFVVSLMQAIAIVTITMLIFLGLRTGIIVSSLIPLAMLMAILVMSFFDIGLDQISLAALIIALGMLVDNGIVMSENILVQMEKGKSALDAAYDSVAELRVPLLTASLTTVAAFLPIYLAESNVGEFTASLFKVVTITLLCSWVIALTVIPMLCVYFLKVEPKNENTESAFYKIYALALNKILKHKYLSLTITVIVFFVAMQGFNFIPKAFFPPSDRNYFKVELELPTGTSIEKMQSVVSDIEAFMSKELKVKESGNAGVTNWVSYIGNAGPKFILTHSPKASSPNYSLMIVNVNSQEVITPTMEKIRQYAFNRHPDLEIKLRRIENGPAVENPIEVRLSGKSPSLFDAVNALQAKMSEINGLRNIGDDWGASIKKLEVSIDQARAIRAGISSEDVAVSLQAGVSGLALSEYREGEDMIPIVLRSRSATEKDIAKVESLSVFSQLTGKSLPLTQVANVELVWEAAKILRRNGVRTVTVGAQLDSGVTATEMVSLLEPWLKEKKKYWAGDINYDFGGEIESSEKANRSIADKLGVAGFFILILLVSQFNSVRKATIILATIPLGLIGVVIGLLVGQSFFGFMTLLGIISLAGIVINNAIVLLERIKLELDAGRQHTEAIVAASQQRARPILLTTATTILGLIPLYISGGEMWEPMAIAIMAGLLFSTVLTLCIVPVLYAILYKVKF